MSKQSIGKMCLPSHTECMTNENATKLVVQINPLKLLSWLVEEKKENQLGLTLSSSVQVEAI